ncbi:MAG: MBL fold metallo-hydrolase [Ignavibacteriaceae bacterium]
MIKFIPLGGAGEIGASCFYLNIAGTGIILDCGMHPQKKGTDALPHFELIKDQPVDYVLISHAHQDHLSALPYLVQHHPYIRIISTPQTRALAELTLHDSVSIMREQLNNQDEDNSIRVYSHEEIDLLIQSIEYKSYGEEFLINGYKHKSSDPVKAVFFDAGHILGSAGILITFRGKKIFYTGDINLDNQSLLPGAELPKEKVDILILETTYGATDSSGILDWHKEAKRFAKLSNKILTAGGSILIPVFSLGKMQEVIAAIWQLMLNGGLTVTDIYTGGLATKISRVYDYNKYAVRRVDKEFEIKSIPQKNLYEVEKPEIFFKNPSFVLASSGMLIEGTVSFRLARKWLKEKNSAIFTVGYMEETTPGYKIINAVRGEKVTLSELFGEEEVRCTVEQFRFSSHTKREGLLEIVNKLKPETVVLVHGDPEAINWVGSTILKISSREKRNVKVYQAEPGKEINW